MTDKIETALTPISQAKRMLAEAKTLPEFRQLRDYATGAKAWAKARGMGIEAQNEASEIILRSEREIGKLLPEILPDGKEAQARRKVVKNQYMAEGMATVHTLQSDKMTLAELGITPTESKNCQRLASLDDETFERMLAAAHVEGKPIARLHFLTAAIERTQTVRPTERGTPSDPGFEAFRRGAHALLGWEINESGEGSPTKNGLMTLPLDELRQFAALTEFLLIAYREAREARSG